MIYRIPDKGDPSDELQYFPQFNLQLLCCRYWWLKNWEFGELSYPYWRIYWNPVPGATIVYNKKEISLDEDRIIMIAPNTSYAAKLFDHSIPVEGFVLKGGRISNDYSESILKERNAIPHLFIHFNIGIPYDNVHPHVFTMNINDHLRDKLTAIKDALKTDFRRFDFHTSLVIKSLIFDLLAASPDQKWELISRDERIINVLHFIELNLNENLSNNILAAHTNLATNAFNRLFKNEVGVSPQNYIRKKRVDKACALLDHSQNTIDAIADDTGFSDRYHFSKIFKQVIGISPGKYRKEFNV